MYYIYIFCMLTHIFLLLYKRCNQNLQFELEHRTFPFGGISSLFSTLTQEQALLKGFALVLFSTFRNPMVGAEWIFLKPNGFGF